jgi:CheY-like chemotaxis protein
MSKKLLLADDSITIQKVIQITFSQEDYQLTIADNGDTAFTQAKVVVPDLVLADVYMPGMNGYELCAAIKQTPALRHVPVLLLTGSFEAFDETKARAAGADDWIEKPFESQALIDKVAALLRAAPAPPAVEFPRSADEPSAAPASTAADEWSRFEPAAAPAVAALTAEDFIFEEIAASEANVNFVEEAVPPPREAPAGFATAADVATSPDFGSEAEEILALADDDILGDDDLEPVDEVVTLTPWSRNELPDEASLQAFAAAPTTPEAGQFSLEPGGEFAAEPAAEVAATLAGEFVPEPAPATDVAPPAPPVAAAAAAGAVLLSEDALERIVERAVVKAIEKLAGTVLEQVAWEVVPDLAESLIKEEIRQIKEAIG